MKELFGMIIFHILIGIWVTQMYIIYQNSGNGRLRFMHFPLYKFYPLNTINKYCTLVNDIHLKMFKDEMY